MSKKADKRQKAMDARYRGKAIADEAWVGITRGNRPGMRQSKKRRKS